jgi:hypothetical protein
MRENRPYGSEGGEGDTLPDPYRGETSARSIEGRFATIGGEYVIEEVAIPLRQRSGR